MNIISHKIVLKFQACNVYDCGFDAGDCGTKDYDKIYEIIFKNGTTLYKVPSGEKSAYLNISKAFGNSIKFNEGSFSSENCVRSVVFAKKFSLVIMVFSDRCNKTQVQIGLSIGSKNYTVSLINFNPIKGIN